ncbi:MAG: hypothetical protein ACXWYS_03070 [Gaiellaceae bacterium]
MRRKKAYGPDYRRPWIRRSLLHERTRLRDHAEHVFLVVLLLALVAAGLMLYLQRR